MEKERYSIQPTNYVRKTSDEELARLGVTTIVDRVLLKEKINSNAYSLRI